MAISNRKILRMTFENASGSSISVTLPEPREDLTGPEVETVMDLIIAKNIFTSSGGDLTAKKDIKIIETTTNDVYEPPSA